MRLVTIDVAAGTLETWVYAPYTGETFTDAAYSETGIDW